MASTTRTWEGRKGDDTKYGSPRERRRRPRAGAGAEGSRARWTRLHREIAWKVRLQKLFYLCLVEMANILELKYPYDTPQANCRIDTFSNLILMSNQKARPKMPDVAAGEGGPSLPPDGAASAAVATPGKIAGAEATVNPASGAAGPATPGAAVMDPQR